MRYFILIMLLVSSPAYSLDLLTDPGVSIELGGVPTLAVSDASTQVFGLGLGANIGLALTTMNKKDLGGKLRFDRYYSKQESLTRSETDYIAQGTYLKSISQQYTMISAGLEWRSKSSGNIFFYEALLGYALGVQGSVEVINRNNASEISSFDAPMFNRFFVMGGLGIKRSWQERFLLLASARTFLIAGTPYDKNLENRTFITVPAILSFGTEYRF